MQIAQNQEWQKGDWEYNWNANGSLKSVKLPNGEMVSYEYDALGRRTKKIVNNKIIRYLWDNNVLLHEWEYDKNEAPRRIVNKLGEVSFNKPEPINNLITWIYETNSFVPCTKIVGNESFSIISDYIGRPILAFDSKGEKVWQTDYDIYGNLRNLKGDRSFIPFRQLGQYEDCETGLYYNRFRYYSPETGLYISKDPIGLAGNNPNLYAYVFDSNTQIDILGLDLHHIIPQSVWKSINKNYDNALKNIAGYVQNVNKKAINTSNLIKLDKPFHGNHPQYNKYVNDKIIDLIDKDNLNLNSIKDLQKDLIEKINDAKAPGKTLNDYFKELTPKCK